MSDILTAEKISELLAGGREKGRHERTIRQFNASGEMYANVFDMTGYKGKDIVSTKNTLTMKIKALGEDFAHIRLVKNGDDLLIVNTSLVEVASDESDEDQ
jgi:hypothetical protein